MTAIQSQIEALYEFALNNPENIYQVVDLLQVGEALAEKIYEETGIDVLDFLVSIDNYSIIHTLLRHGNPAQEAKQGQIAVTKADFTKLLEIVTMPDSVRLDAKVYGNGVVKETLIFTKEFEHFYVVAKEIRRVLKKGKPNRLILQTMYIRKKA